MYLSEIMHETSDGIPAGSPEILNLFAFDAKVASPLLRMTQEVMRGSGPLTFGERELIAALVSKQNGCLFCMSSHTVAASELYGFPQVSNVMRGLEFTDREHAFIELARASKVSDPETRERLVDNVLGYLTQEEIFQVNTIIALFNFYNTWVQMNGVSDMTPAGYLASGKRIATEGYQQ